MESLRPLRIALVLPAFTPAVEYGGPISKVTALVGGLQELGHHPEVWCANFGPGRSRVPAGRRDVGGVPVRYLRRVASYRWSPVVPQAALLPARIGVDVGHCFGMWDGLTLFAAMGFRRGRIPYVVEPIGMYPPQVRSVRMKRFFDMLSGPNYLGGAAALVATSEREAEVLRASTKNSIHVRLNPVRMTAPPLRTGDLRRQLGMKEDEKVLGWVGRISRSKGLDVLIDALALLPDHHLVLVGPDDGDGAAAILDRAIDRNGLGERVHRLGPRWGAERDQLLVELDVFVLPSVTENFGNAAVEAAAFGVPVVVSDRVGGAAWLWSQHAAVVSPLAPAPLADAIRQAGTQGPGARSTLASAAAVRDGTSPVRIAKDQVDIYHAVGVGN